MKKLSFLLLLILGGTGLANAQELPTFDPDEINIPYKKFVLQNGLRLIVHEDHKAPIVAVNVWYHVGSKNEKPGKTGFAHLFEHLMFNGSENFNDDYFQALERIGGTDLNGTTDTDRTNYFQNVPVGALDRVLWLESDRMGHLLGAIDQEKLDEQRGVVQNEKRQGENQPYGRSDEMMTHAMYPAGHPYSWTVIGSMEDLDAASLDDVHEWFKTYYGAANAVLVIAGDVEAEAVHQKVIQYFGDIPPGPTLAKQEVNIAPRTQHTRQYYQDRVPEARIEMGWNTPEWGNETAVYLELVSRILSSGKNSRLYKKLIYEDQVASNAYTYQYSKEIGGEFHLIVNVKPGQSTAQVERTALEVLDEFLEKGPTEAELNKVKAAYMASFIKGMERIGGFGGKSDILAENEVYGGSPDYYKEVLKMVQNATVEDLHAAAKKWLTQGRHTLVCEPFPEYSTVPSEIDRSQMPETKETIASTFPATETTTLSNGLKVTLARREGVPTLVMNMMFDAGYASDQFSKPGTASLAMNLLDEGTESMSALEINDRLQILGASIGASSDLDASYLSMNTLVQSLDPSLDLYADVLLRPSFAEKEFERLRQLQLAGIEREKSQPITMAIRVAPKIMYGENHAYSIPFTGSGYKESVESMTLADVKGFYETWLRPNNAHLVVVGDITMANLKPKLEARLGDWQKKKTPKKNIAKVAASRGKTLYLMDRPESQQSTIIAGHLTAPYGAVNEIAQEAMINVLGGEFTSRINMNLREDKHWSYGAFSLILEAKGQRPFLVLAPVQTDKTAESVEEIIKELTGFVGDQPITDEEFEKTRKNAVLQLPGSWETNSAVAASVIDVQKYGLDADYYQTYDQRLLSLDLQTVRGVAGELVMPDNLIWFVVGDKEKILPKLDGIGFDKIITIDAEGNPLSELSGAK